MSANPIDNALRAFILRAANASRTPVLIIDGTEAAFPEPADDSERKAVSQALRALHAYTIGTKQLSVLLVTSDFQEAQRLGYAGSVTDTVVVGDIDLQAMRGLLERVWGAGPHLASQLVSIYGGDI